MGLVFLVLNFFVELVFMKFWVEPLLLGEERPGELYFI